MVRLLVRGQRYHVDESPETERMIWQPDSIYGFSLNGVKYQYFSQLKLYVALLATGTPVHFYLKDRKPGALKHFLGSIRYNTEGNETLGVFSKKNIKAEFSDRPALMAKLEKIWERIGKYEGDFTRRSFRKAREAIEEEFK